MPRYRIRYSKEGAARYMSHLDLVRTFERAVRRAGLPVAMSQGFNPHPKIAFAFPLPVGVSGLEEYVDIEYDEDLLPEDIARSLNRAMPPGLGVSGARKVEDGAPALMALVERSCYIVRASRSEFPGLDQVLACLEKFMGQERIAVPRQKKDGSGYMFDIRPGILAMSAREDRDQTVLEMDLMSGSSLNIRPGEVISAVRDKCGFPAVDCRCTIIRTRVMGPGGKELF